MLTSCFFVGLVMGITLIQMYYICLLGQVTYFSIKEGSEILVAPFESSTQLTELNFHPLFNFDPQKVL